MKVKAGTDWIMHESQSWNCLNYAWNTRLMHNLPELCIKIQSWNYLNYAWKSKLKLPELCVKIKIWDCLNFSWKQKLKTVWIMHGSQNWKYLNYAWNSKLKIPELCMKVKAITLKKIQSWISCTIVDFMIWYIHVTFSF